MPTNSKEYMKKNYEKYRGTPEMIQYRTELNRINHQKGTYGNGDGKDEHHYANGKTKPIPQEINRRMGAREAIKVRKAKLKY